MIEYGVDEADIFQSNDLAEKRDLGAVTNTMFALGRAVSIFLAGKLHFHNDRIHNSIHNSNK